MFEKYTYNMKKCRFKGKIYGLSPLSHTEKSDNFAIHTFARVH